MENCKQAHTQYLAGFFLIYTNSQLSGSVSIYLSIYPSLYLYTRMYVCFCVCFYYFFLLLFILFFPPPPILLLSFPFLSVYFSDAVFSISHLTNCSVCVFTRFKYIKQKELVNFSCELALISFFTT